MKTNTCVAILAFVAICITAANAAPPQRIINGLVISIGSVPSTVSIRYKYMGHICGGALVSNQHVVTAAHCLTHRNRETGQLTRFDNELLRVVPGHTVYYPGVEEFELEKVYIHPNFTGDFESQVNERADIAIIKLAKPIVPGPGQKPIEMSSQRPEDFSNGEAVGWGTERNDSSYPSLVLHGILVKAYNSSSCGFMFPNIHIADDEICTVSHPNTSVCHRDNGGPVFFLHQLTGIISYKYLCTHELPALLTSVPYHKSWIETAINETAKFVEIPVQTGP